MQIIKKAGLMLFLLLPLLAFAQKLTPAVTQPISITQLQGFDENPEIIQKLITQAQQLTQLNLTYLFGSADPSRHGMDCSGTVYYLLKHSDVNDIPRSAHDIYLWAKQKGKFYSVSSNDFQSPEFSQLKPGDLLFWSGTYPTNHSDYVTHVMIYLGKNIQNQPLMFGSSDGRVYNGHRMWGVSVFDFNLPKPGASSHFIGYSCIPGLTCELQMSK